MNKTEQDGTRRNKTEHEDYIRRMIRCGIWSGIKKTTRCQTATVRANISRYLPAESGTATANFPLAKTFAGELLHRPNGSVTFSACGRSKATKKVSPRDQKESRAFSQTTAMLPRHLTTFPVQRTTRLAAFSLLFAQHAVITLLCALRMPVYACK